MAKRKKLTPNERQLVYKKFDGKCAYCGINFRFEDMQVDHIIPISGWNEQGTDSLDNMYPACRSCNHYKRANTLEGWRKILENIPNTLERDCYTYKQAVRFGLVEPKPKKIIFYFEKYGQEMRS